MRLVKRVWRNFRSLRDIAKEQGFVTACIQVLEKVRLHQEAKKRGSAAEGSGVVTPLMAKGQSIFLRVPWQEAKSVDWGHDAYTPQCALRSAVPRVAWIMPPPDNGGGHQNIFRFVTYLHQAGMVNDIYLSSTFDRMTPAEARRNVSSYCPVQDLTFVRFTPGMAIDADVIFATGWETVYDLASIDSPALKYYFVQDFEPFFYPVGTDYVLAENSYRMGYPAITAGRWLAHKLSEEYGMVCHPYDFGADKGRYFVTNRGTRKAVMFYARPATERRGFPLGILALELFHEMRPDVEIHLAGWDVRQWEISFPYVHHGSMKLDQLNDLYNRCAASLVISLTNMSLLPLELLSSGVIPVVTQGDNNSMVSDNGYISYCRVTPRAMAEALAAAVESNERSELADAASASVPSDTWDMAGAMLVRILEDDLRTYGA